MGTSLSDWMYLCVFGTSYVPKRGGTREPTASALAQAALFEAFRTTIEALPSKAFKVLGREGSKHCFEGRER